MVKWSWHHLFETTLPPLLTQFHIFFENGGGGNGAAHSCMGLCLRSLFWSFGQCLSWHQDIIVFVIVLRPGPAMLTLCSSSRAYCLYVVFAICLSIFKVTTTTKKNTCLDFYWYWICLILLWISTHLFLSLNCLSKMLNNFPPQSHPAPFIRLGIKHIILLMLL